MSFTITRRPDFNPKPTRHEQQVTMNLVHLHLDRVTICPAFFKTPPHPTPCRNSIDL
ncbi:hypothetical protein RISK_000933 [Rhodopirellula islandica]|uniref:Uncharacterized protein n=1 Tax=Rhodopirellula islandica TaxID=595434 RepID=A0A0J1BKV2_RHOIS|nr:hypothetical protein RISK_000933 [Rhodopirellula islandica]